MLIHSISWSEQLICSLKGAHSSNQMAMHLEFLPKEMDVWSVLNIILHINKSALTLS
jgi:hypothetical protein